MVKKVSNWFEENQVIIGSAVTLIIYGIGLYVAVSDKISANTVKDGVYQEKVDQHDKQLNSHDKRLDDFEVTMKQMSEAIHRIDNNVVEIKTEVKYKKDK